MNYEMGCKMAISDWVWLNRIGVFEDTSLRQYVSPFPPSQLMENVSGLTCEKDFASHGADMFVALSDASPMPLTEYRNILDFGCGCGRLARMFKGHPHNIAGCDIDSRHIDWISGNLDFMSATLSSVKPPLPYSDNEFDGIISISIFSHLNEKSQDEFLSELYRICAPGGYLFLTVHGEQALNRSVNEKPIRDMIWVEEIPFQNARRLFSQDKHAFILQNGHLTTVLEKSFSNHNQNPIKVIKEPFEYGITFIPETYIRKHWGQWFDIVDYRHGAIHSFQDIVVLKPKK